MNNANVNVSAFLRIPWLMWDAAMFLTDSFAAAVIFYHEASLEILELIGNG